MSVAVVIVAHNSGSVLSDCLAALCQSTLVTQIFLIDNASALDDPGIIAAQVLARRDARLQLQRNTDNLGFAAAVNQGAKAVNQPWLLVLNPDCIVPAPTLGALLAQAIDLPGLGVMGCLQVDADGRSEPASCRRDLSLGRLLVDALQLYRLGLSGFAVRPLPTELCAVAQVSGALMLLPTQSFTALDGLDAGYFLHFEDLDLCLRARQSGLKVYFSPLQVTHVKGTSSKGNPAAVRQHKLQSLQRYLSKHRVPFAPVILAFSRLALWLR